MSTYLPPVDFNRVKEAALLALVRHAADSCLSCRGRGGEFRWPKWHDCEYCRVFRDYLYGVGSTTRPHKKGKRGAK